MATHEDLTNVNDVSQDSGCTVDWRWLEGLQIESATSDLQHWKVRFTNGQTLTIQASEWQGKAFLAFNPYKPRG